MKRRVLFMVATAMSFGAQKILAGKPLQLTGGPTSPPPPKDRNVYGALMAAGAADVFRRCWRSTASPQPEAALYQKRTVRRVAAPAVHERS